MIDVLVRRARNPHANDVIWLETDNYVVFCTETLVPELYESAKYGSRFNDTGRLEFNDRRELTSKGSIPDEVKQICETIGFIIGQPEKSMSDVRDRLYSGVTET